MRARIREIWAIAGLVVSVLSPFVITAPAAHALACVEDCIPDPPPPSQPGPGCGASCIPSGHPTATITGVVKNIRGVPLANATVYWTYGSVVTSGNGAYTILVWTDAPVTITATHSLHAWRSIIVADPSQIGSRIQNFSLYFLLNVSVSPDAFNTTQFGSQDITYSVYSTAPVAGSRALIRQPGGTHIQLQHDVTYVNPEGWSRWTGTRTVGIGTPEGRYTFRGCVVDEIGTSQCEVGALNLLSQVKTAAYAADYTPPAITAFEPLSQHNTILPRASLGATISDVTSGLSSTPPTMTTDGAVVVGTFNPATGRLTYSPAADWSAGLHTVAVSATDAAGNTGSASWQFNEVSLTATSASARIVAQTVDVNPAGSNPPPTTLTFSNVSFTLDPYTLTLGPTTFTGHGSVSRAADATTARARFTNGAGSVTVSLGLGSLSFQQSSAVVLPRSSSATLSAGSQTLNLGSISIPVPTGYGASGTTATLEMDPQPAGTPSAPAGDPTPTAIPNGVSVVTVALKVGTELTDNSPTSVAISTGSWNNVDGVITLPNGTAVPIYTSGLTNPPSPGDPGLVFNDVPDLQCNGSPGDISCLYSGSVPASGYLSKNENYFNLGENAAQFYATHWLFRRATESVYVDWHQSSGRVASSISCATGSIHLSLSEFTNKARQLLQSTHPWNIDRVVISGAPDPLGQSTVTLGWGSSNSIQNTGVSSSGSVFTPTQDSSSSTGSWTRPGGSNNSEQMITATEFSSATPGYPKMMSLEESHTWKVTYDRNC